MNYILEVTSEKPEGEIVIDKQTFTDSFELIRRQMDLMATMSLLSFKVICVQEEQK